MDSVPKNKPWNKEQEKVFQGVFGRSTLLALSKLMNEGHFSTLYGEINSGKEASIFVGEDSSGRLVAVKIYRIEASDFGNMLPYIKGDERFEKVGPSKREIVEAWTRKEFSNLSKLELAGVRVPHPIAFRQNVLIFELVLAADGSIAPKLKDAAASIEDKAKFAETLVKYVALARKKAELVHSDLSEYNVLVGDDNGPVIIDCGQAVLLSHPNSLEFLKRDCKNLASFLTKRLGVRTTEEEILKRVI